MIIHSEKKLLDALTYVAGRKCVNCGKNPAAPCSHDCARAALKEHADHDHHRSPILPVR